MAERHAAAPHAAVRGGDAGGLAAGDASRATGTSVATVTTSLAAVELCDEDVAMRCSAQSDAGSAADPEWEAVLAQLLAEEAEEEELCCRFERRGDDSDDGWDNYSEEGEEDAVQSVAGKAAPTSMGYHSCDCIEEGFNIQQTGIEGDRMSASDVSSVPIALDVFGAWQRSIGTRELTLARAALRYKVGLAYHGNAAETGEYLYDPSYAPTLDIGLKWSTR
ncbi:hypothetical protein EMIHUDRAFT_203691 [Emiliania huxleyi CCMP1516]|uniref:Uncharacterized protein n=2 Tax=Emiliania huxleyi TaxID=2903 RepID=A0A0D3K088_EMIH1|nr:hypothetical protein EMIHUDRAFT_203691 [Emiliania huxleyi CCMP1516]EOD29173.1 hypothetical protein EMIHUDRAFT_203691 [Emiliania huxleyi CCMP1516]|eukprot:XP_005781602.1 hypothetical protein EMIHUDRAFT_203691 [Emiliania huxleyi CCMP1516]